MLQLGDYPPGVTDKTIYDYFGDNGECCKYCTHYYHCDSSCSLKERVITAEEEDEMTNEEYEERIHTDPDDYCDDFEAEEEDWREDR